MESLFWQQKAGAVSSHIATAPVLASLHRYHELVQFIPLGSLVVVASGSSDQGARAAVAILLRSLFASPSAVSSGLCLSHAPPPWLATRGHQLTTWGYAFQPWPAAAQQYVNELVTFGTNQVCNLNMFVLINLCACMRECMYA